MALSPVICLADCLAGPLYITLSAADRIEQFEKNCLDVSFPKTARPDLTLPLYKERMMAKNTILATALANFDKAAAMLEGGKRGHSTFSLLHSLPATG